MKSKKISLSALILIVAVLVAVLYSAVSSIAKKPTITEGEFPFSITYELDGETITINDVYEACYVSNGGYADSKYRVYVGGIRNLGEGNTVYTLKKDGNTRVELWTKFYPDYLMGDTEYDYFDDEAFEPHIYYYDSNEQEYSDEETLLAQGVKLIGFEYPTPIENSFVFSHLSYFSHTIVLPVLLIALLALVAIMIFVRKEKERKYKAVDIISIILIFIVSFIFIPIVLLFALLIDIEGGGPELYYQVLYFLPSFSVLCIAASVALRRKGYGVKSLITGLMGPMAFAVYLIVFVLCDLL